MKSIGKFIYFFSVIDVRFYFLFRLQFIVLSKCWYKRYFRFSTVINTDRTHSAKNWKIMEIRVRDHRFTLQNQNETYSIFRFLAQIDWKHAFIKRASYYADNDGEPKMRKECHNAHVTQFKKKQNQSLGRRKTERDRKKRKVLSRTTFLWFCS